MPQDYAARLATLVKARFSRAGFSPKRQVLVKPMGVGVSAFLGLSRNCLRDGTVVYFPVVGVRFEPVYRLGRELGCYPESETNPTLSIALEYLLPTSERHEYVFTENLDDLSQIERLAADVEQYGIPFLDSISTVDAAAGFVLGDSLPQLSGKHEFLPLRSCLAGDRQAALEIAKEYLAGMDPSRGTGKRYAEFVGNLTASRCSDR